MRVGSIDVLPISDGAFVARPRYFGAAVPDDARPDVFDRDGAAWLPIGCFLIRTGARVVLVDAGLGPASDPMPHRMTIVGGQLLTGLRAAGIAPWQITDIVCTHLHMDHVGWLFDTDALPVFPGATIWFGAAEWEHFVEGPGVMAPHIRAGFRALHGTDALRAVGGPIEIAGGVTAVPAPGHTPGHVAVSVADGEERLVLLGDAITMPAQLDEPGWHSMGDVEADGAERTRRLLLETLSDGFTCGVGAHFPELLPGRMVDGGWKPLS